MGLLKWAEVCLGSQPPLCSLRSTNYVRLNVNSDGLTSRKEPIGLKLGCEVLNSPGREYEGLSEYGAV